MRGPTKTRPVYCRGMAGARVQLGLERLLEDPALVKGRRVTVLANQASVTSRLEPAWQALTRAGVDVVRIFAPEHGLWGLAQDMEAVGETHEPVLGVPAVSLYGATPETLTPTPEQLAGVDAVVADLPDIGCRYYTFAATLAHVMAACERAGAEVIVCDRPNPLGGLMLEGGPVEPACRSFVSELPTPVRHGMTLGELALLLRAQRHPELSLAVLTCAGWRREMWWDETGLPWVAPSPNMPTPLSAAIYPGACLVEATNLSEGRGTTRPFQLVGAPWLAADELARRLNTLALPGVWFRATRFRPEFGKHAGKVCHGVEWHVVDRAALRPLATGVRLLAEARALHPTEFAWRAAPYEFIADVPAIDLLTGSPAARAVIEGRSELGALLDGWRLYCERFSALRSEFLLYT